MFTIGSQARTESIQLARLRAIHAEKDDALGEARGAKALELEHRKDAIVLEQASIAEDATAAREAQTARSCGGLLGVLGFVGDLFTELALVLLSPVAAANLLGAAVNAVIGAIPTTLVLGGTGLAIGQGAGTVLSGNNQQASANLGRAATVAKLDAETERRAFDAAIETAGESDARAERARDLMSRLIRDAKRVREASDAA